MTWVFWDIGGAAFALHVHVLLHSSPCNACCCHQGAAGPVLSAVLALAVPELVNESRRVMRKMTGRQGLNRLSTASTTC